jgi:hypothetical protein
MHASVIEIAGRSRVVQRWSGRAAGFCAATTALLFAVSLPLYSGAGLTIAWRSAVPLALVLAMVLAVWRLQSATARGDADTAIADAMAVLLLMLLLFAVATPAQYLALSLQRPLTDAALARADSALGVDVAALAAWTRAHRFALYTLYLAYSAFVPLLVAPILLLGFVYRRRDRLWEYCFHFHCCLIVTIVIFALYPAESAFQYRRFTPALDEAGFIAHFTAVRSGAFHVIRFGSLEGLVSMPSFHAIGGMLAAWALRGLGAGFMIVALVSLTMVASTFLTGVHYVVDIAGAAAVVGGSLLVHAWIVQPRRDR